MSVRSLDIHWAHVTREMGKVISKIFLPSWHFTPFCLFDLLCWPRSARLPKFAQRLCEGVTAWKMPHIMKKRTWQGPCTETSSRVLGVLSHCFSYTVRRRQKWMQWTQWAWEPKTHAQEFTYLKKKMKTTLFNFIWKADLREREIWLFEEWKIEKNAFMGGQFTVWKTTFNNWFKKKNLRTARVIQIKRKAYSERTEF